MGLFLLFFLVSFGVFGFAMLAQPAVLYSDAVLSACCCGEFGFWMLEAVQVRLGELFLLESWLSAAGSFLRRADWCYSTIAFIWAFRGVLLGGESWTQSRVSG